MNPLIFLMIVVSVSLNALAQLVLRKAMLTLGVLPPPTQVLNFALTLLRNPWLWAGMGCYAASIGIWLAVLARVPVSLAYPMLSIGYVVAAVLGVVFLREAVGVSRALGIGVICVGVFLVSRSA